MTHHGVMKLQIVTYTDMFEFDSKGNCIPTIKMPLESSQMAKYDTCTSLLYKESKKNSEC